MTRNCRCCGKEFTCVGMEVRNRQYCDEHKGARGGVGICKAEGCGISFAKTGAGSTYCSDHRYWQQGKPAKRRGKIHKRTWVNGECKTCGAAFQRKHPSSKYCSDDHNPLFLSRPEQRELRRDHAS